MTIYVDELQTYTNKGRLNGLWCHMMCDGDIAELHVMALHLGLRQYFQSHPSHPHYDLRPSKRAAAIEAGAIAVGGVEMVDKCSVLLRRIRERHLP